MAFIFLIAFTPIVLATANNFTFLPMSTGSGSTFVDNSNNSYDGTAESGANWSTNYPDFNISNDGASYSAIFPGIDSRIDLDAHANNYNDLDTATVNFWLNCTDDFAFSDVFSAGDWSAATTLTTVRVCGSAGDGCTVSYADESLYFQVYLSSSLHIGFYYRDGAGMLCDDTWHMVTLWVNSSNNGLHIDGLPGGGTFTYNGGSASVGGYFLNDANIDKVSIGLRGYNGALDNEYNHSLDHFEVWTDRITDAEILNLYNYGYEDGVGPPVNTPPTHANPILNSTDHPLNFTDANLTCYNQSTSDVDGDNLTNRYRWFIDGAVNNSLENETSIPTGITQTDQNWICEVSPHDGTSYGISKNSTALLIREVLIVSEEYASTIYETTTGNFNISLAVYSGISNGTATLTYNNTNYTTDTLVETGGYLNFSLNISIPLVESNNTAKNFNWTFNLNRTNGSTTTSNSSTNSQNVYFAYLFLSTEPSKTYLLEDENFRVTSEIEKNVNIATLSLMHHYNGTNTSSALNTSNSTYEQYVHNFTTFYPLPSDSVNQTITAYLNVTFGGVSFIRQQTTTINVSKLLIDNCSVYSTMAVNFTLKNESDDSAVVGTLAGYFEIYVDDDANFRSFNLTWSSDSTYGICIGQAYTNVTLDAQLIYGSTGFTDETYYFNSAVLDNATNYIDLILTPGSSQVTITVTDEDDNELVGAFVSILTYDLTTNSYVTTEIVETDSEGKAVASLVLVNEWYKFIVNYEGATVLETEPTKVLLTSLTLRVNLGIDFFPNFNYVDSIATSLSFTNATQNFRYTFSNPTGESVTACLKVERQSINSISILNETCETTSSGSILITINSTGFTGSFIGTGKITYESEDYITDVLSVSFDEQYKVWGKSGLFVTFLLILTLSLIGIWHPVAAVVLLIAGIFLATVFDIFSIGWAAMSGLIIVGAIAIYKLNER